MLLEMLPKASTSAESIQVLLDSFSGHLTDEVAAISKTKAHVLISHMGATTPFTQINDTHLHGVLPSRYVRMVLELSAKEQM